jgi:hypothetical protein
MRNFLIFLLLPIKLFSQDVEGVWTGTIYNDTTHKYIPYEIAISKSKGKLSGFSHTIFIGENNRNEIGVKSLKIKKKGDKILIEDDELIYNNYAEPAPKGIKQYSVLNVMQGDSGLLLIGVFSTNRTKEYASLTGIIHLQKKNKISENKIIPKLDEMNLAGSLSFIQNKPKEELAMVPPVIKNIQPPQPKEKEGDVAIILPNTKKEFLRGKDDDRDKPSSLIMFKEDTVEYKADVITSKDIGIVEKPKKEDKIVVAIKNQPVIKPKKEVVVSPAIDTKKIQSQSRLKPITTDNIPINKKPQSIPLLNIQVPVNTQVVTKKQDDNSLSKNKVNNLPIDPSKQPIGKSVLTSAPSISITELAKRKIETIRTVNFKSDSLLLTLYDNGEVDGDTVSVLLNGKNIMPRQGLSTKPISKTIYITPDLGDSLQLIMYAENLGSIPPNTGLLIIHDGEDIYQIRFAGDLQKNSAIILHRKKN